MGTDGLKSMSVIVYFEMGSESNKSSIRGVRIDLTCSAPASRPSVYRNHQRDDNMPL
ncbi:Uncharacterised protein [uncultured archaeon]|nr:Uncharacterised protein [uncultured archaeon]